MQNTRIEKAKRDRWALAAKSIYPVEERAATMLGAAWMARLPWVIRFFTIFLRVRTDGLRKASLHGLIADLPAAEARRELIRFLSGSENARAAYGGYLADLADLFRKASAEVASEAPLMGEDADGAVDAFEETVAVLACAVRRARKLS